MTSSEYSIKIAASTFCFYYITFTFLQNPPQSLIISLFVYCPSTPSECRSNEGKCFNQFPDFHKYL